MAQAAAVLPDDQTLPPPDLDSPPDDLPAPPPKQRRGGTGPSKRWGAEREDVNAKESFWDYLNGLNSTDWESHMLYVYMWDPIVDLTKGGREAKYRKRYTSTLNEESLKRDVGSGTYNLKLNRLDQATRKERTIRELVVNIFDPDYPPNIPPGGWLDDPRNKEWAWAKPLLEKKWAVPNPAQPNGSTDPAVIELARIVDRLAKSPQPNHDPLAQALITWALKQTSDEKEAKREERKADRESDSPGKLAELIKIIRDLLPQPTPQNNELMTFVLSQLAAVQKQNGELLAMLLANKTQEQNPLSMVDTFGKLVAAVSGIVQPAAPKEPWVEFAENVTPQVLPVLDKLATGLALMNRPAPRPNPSPGAVVVPHPPVSSVPPQPAPVVTVQAQPVPDPQPAQPNPLGELDTMQRSMLIQIAHYVMGALSLGLEGDEFAEKVCTSIFNDKMYDEFVSSVPKDQLLGLMKAIPEAWNPPPQGAGLVQFEGALPKFIESFYSYAEQEEPEITKPISQPIPVSAKKKAKAKTK